MVASAPRHAEEHAEGRAEVYRYVPPKQAIARAETYIEDILLHFTLTFSGSLLVTCPVLDAVDGSATEDRADLQLAGATLDRIADGLFISAVRADRPAIESTGGRHRFRHVTTSLRGPRTRRFAGECTIDIPGASTPDEPAISGSLDYTLDVTAAAPSDPVGSAQGAAGERWSERYDRTLASIGAVVLSPVPVSAERAARLYAT